MRGGLVALALGAAALAAPAGAAPWFSAYKDIEQGFDRETGRVAIGPDAPPLVTLAFASGECGAEHWAGRDAQRFADSALPALVQGGRRFVVSTGGEAGVFTCASAAGMQRFVERYLGPGLVGFDFDIEGRQTAAQIDALVGHAAAAQQRWPQLVFSFTLATHAGSDGRGQGLNRTGIAVMRALKKHRFEHAVVNLMVMNYGAASARLCVLRAGGGCDMGRSGLQAAQNLRARFGVPFERIALTAMIGVNDVTENRFDAEDARRLAADVREHGLQGLHFWSIDRDRPCAEGAAVVSAVCSGLVDVPAGAYTRVFAQTLGQGR